MALYALSRRITVPFTMPLLDALLGARCRLCGKHGVTPLGAIAPTHPAEFHTSEFRLLHCSHCEVVYLDPLPTKGDLKLLYEESKQFTDAHYTDPDQVRKILSYYDSAIRSRNLLPKKSDRVLEIGAGLAWVARACKEIDSTVETMAQDVSAECANTCPWVDHYYVGALDTLPDRGPYQLISLTHVFEHVTDPASMLRAISLLLAPGGAAFITAPFRPSSWRRGQGIDAWRDYSYLHVPAHITYFSRRWFELHAPPEFRIAHWDASHENGQAFELVLRRN